LSFAASFIFRFHLFRLLLIIDIFDADAAIIFAAMPYFHFSFHYAGFSHFIFFDSLRLDYHFISFSLIFLRYFHFHC